MKKISLFFVSLICMLFTSISVFAAQYTIQSDDTMWLIAKKHGITVEELILANPQIPNPDIIWEGLVINIPDTGITVPSPAPSTGGRESLTYLYAGTPVSYVKIIDTSNNSLKTISPDYFDIDANGNLLITPSNKIDTGFIKEMHGRGIKITPFISNHWDKEKGNAALDNAETLSTQLVDMIIKYDLDGVNIDIENVNEKYRQAYTNFTRLVRDKLPKDKLVTVAVAANPKGWTTGWHGSYDYKALSDYSDYLMVMAYDESYYGGPAGPISSSDFFNGSIEYAIKQGVPKSKIVTGIPFFGRYWKEGQAVGGSGITAGDIEFLAANYQSEKYYDEAAQSANVIITIQKGDPEPKIWGGQVLTAGTYNIWYDDLKAVKYKLGQINKYDIHGAGSWALGQENTETWRFYVDALNGNLPSPEPTPITHNVTFNVVSGNGTLTANVSGTPITSGIAEEEGKDIVFNASPTGGYRVKDWKMNDSIVSGNTSNSYTINNLSAAANVTVEFELIPIPTHAVTFNIVNGNGTLTADVDGIGIASGTAVKEGKDIIFNALPVSGYRVKDWKMNGSVVTGNTSNSYTINNLTAAASVTVEFEPIPTPTHTVTFNVVNGNGTLMANVDGTGIASGTTVKEGNNVIFNASPNAGYRVKDWKLNSAVVSGNTTNSYTLNNLTGAANVSVEFEAIPSMPAANLDKIIYILNENGNTRKVTSTSTLTRGEVAVIVSEITYLKPEPDGDTFADTANYWGKAQINALKRRGILRETNNTFNPNSNIRKDDLAVVLERVLVLPDTIDFHTIMTFKDVVLADYAYNAISKMCYFDIMAGQNKNFFKPESTVTVSDMAKMLDIIDKNKYPMNPDQHMPKPGTRTITPPNPDKEPVIQPR